MPKKTKSKKSGSYSHPFNPALIIEFGSIFFLGIFLLGAFGFFLPRSVSGEVSGISETQANLPLPLPTVNPIPQAINPSAEPLLTAKAAYILDPVTQTVLYRKNPYLRLPPASTTKLMTAFVALREYDPQAVVTVKDADRSVGQTANLVSGEEITVENLIKALLITSGNDAAVALAQNHPLGYAHFVTLMNQTAADLNLKSTHFTNVSGIEEPDHYSTAADLTVLAQEVIRQPLIGDIVATKNAVVTDISGLYRHPLTNINQLLGTIDGVTGIKTGWTQAAGECLITRVERNGLSLIITVLGSNDRFGETTKLIDWAYQNFKVRQSD